MKYLHCGVAVLGMFFFSCQENKKSLEFDKNQADLRFEGNRQMALILDSLNTVANFQTNYFLSGKRAEQLLINKPAFKSGKEAIVWNLKYAFELLNSGNAHGAINEIETFLKDFNGSDEEKIRIPQFKSLYELLAVAYLRHGENENCVANHNSESCILPLKGKAIHVKKNGSQQAMRYYAMLLEVYPDDIQLKWLFNIAAMTLGDFPQGVPEKFRIDFAAVDTKVTGFTPLYNAATDLGVDVKGLSGAGIIEDFNGDGFMDVFASSYGIQDNATLFFSDGKGGFIDVTDSAQLRGITGGLNAKQADFNNDGFMDILLLRGAWLDEGGEWPNSLLRNNGDGTFSDVTFAAGMGSSFYPTETATWADVNNDGWVDVFIANENNDKNAHPCELFINNGDGTFTDKAKDWGMDGNFGYAKAANFADFNNDGWMDLFLGCLGQPNYLFMNRGKQPNGELKFENIAGKAGVTLPNMSFPAIVVDFDHNGYPDILSTSFPLNRLDYVAQDVGEEMLGIPNKVEKTKLFLNQGNETFKEVSRDWNIDKMIFAMGFNSGDLNNDGWIDVYAGTGAFAFTTLVPNRVFLNRGGKGFDEVTMGSGMGHLQKGHGIGFGDLDNDGDQDVYVTLGGAVEGDDAHNALFVNPNTGNNWLRLQLRSSENKNSIGARVRVTGKTASGNLQNWYHTVGDGGTFGSNSMELEIGMGALTEILEVGIDWPGRKREVYKGFAINKAWICKEGVIMPQIRKLSRSVLKGNSGSKACCK
jgi:hypothetical protein